MTQPFRETPLACSLTADAQRARQNWIGDLSERLLSRTPTPDGISLRYRAGAETERQLRELAAAESDCCPFLELDVVDGGDAVELIVRGPADARPIIDELFGRPGRASGF